MEVRLGQVSSEQTELLNLEQEQAQGNVKTAAPLLNGASVVVSAKSDFSKLLAEMQEEIDARKLSSAKIKLSGELERLTGIANGLTETQNASLVALQIATEALERLVELYKVTKEERKKLIEKKERLEGEKATLEGKIESLDKEIASTTDKKALEKLQKERAEAAASLAAKDKELSGVTAEIGKADENIEAQLVAIDKAYAVVEGAAKKLDSQCLSVLDTALRLTASQAVGVANGLEKEDEQDVADELSKSVAGILLKMLEAETEELRDELERKRTALV